MLSYIKRNSFLLSFLAISLVLISGFGRSTLAGEGTKDPDAERAAYFEMIAADIAEGLDDPESPALSFTPCVGGFAGPYPCENVDLLAFLPLGSIGGGSGNDIWGWTDPQDGKEYALMGRSSGTSFIDISNPESPVYLGNLPPHTSNSSWRDIKVYNNYAFIVSEAGGHGMQVFDLTRLRSVGSPPETFTEDAHYAGFGNAHNIVINEGTGYAYAVGTSTCSGGLHFVNISNPLTPTGAGCYSGDGYTHDAQCVIYTGPDNDYAGSEICFAYNEDTLTIVDVTNKGAPVLVAREGYVGDGYTHQGWVTEDQEWLLLDDELDESSFGHNTRTRIWDITDLDNPVLTGFFDGPNDSIDHNLYIKEGYAYESNYSSGLHILSIADIGSATLELVAFFDTFPSNNNTSFDGSWSNYPYFDSGVIVISDIDSGFFVVQPTLAADYNMTVTNQDLEVCVAGTVNTTININPSSGYVGTVNLSTIGLPAGTTADFTPSAVVVPGSSDLELTIAATAPGTYNFDVHGNDGSIEHDRPVTLDILSGTPAAPGLTFPADGAVDVEAGVVFTWSAAAEAESYTFELASDPGFSVILDSAVETGTSHTIGVALDPLTTYYWRVGANNLCGAGAPSAARSFTTRNIPPVLLVDDDDNDPNVRSDYTDALDALGLTYDIFDTGNSDDEPGAIDLGAYAAVVWFSGDEFGGFAGPGSAGEDALAGWLDEGGCLFVSSQDYLYDHQLTSFMTTYLGIDDAGPNDTGNYTSVDGVGVFSGLGPYLLDYAGAGVSDFSDHLLVGNGGEQAFVGNNDNVGAVSKASGDYKTTFWAFPWETLPEAGREASLDAFMTWCGLGDPPEMPFDIFLPVVIKD